MATCRGFTKVRNEEPYIHHTLDVWAEVCLDGIHVYCDCCTDGTAEVCRAHPAVVEVLESDYYDPDRARADQRTRQMMLTSVQRFDSEWIAYFDADEHLEDFPLDCLDDPSLTVIAPHWYDVYITPEEVETDYRERTWVCDDPRLIPLFFRRSPTLGFSMPDQRIMSHASPPYYPLAGHLRHYGLGRSVEDWERKVRYYQEWPQYKDKWATRSGQAIRTDYTSVTGSPLRPYQEVKNEREHRRMCALAKAS